MRRPCRASLTEGVFFLRGVLRRAPFVRWLVVGAALSVGCFGGSASVPPAKAPAMGATTASAPSEPSEGVRRPSKPGVTESGEGHLRDASWGWLETRPFSLLVPAPDVTAWAAIERGRWFVARHRTTDSTLAVRAWPARRRVTRDDCEAELLLGRPELRQPEGVPLVDEREGIGPAGFHSRVRVWSDATGRGVALATGAGPGRCWAVVFRTRASVAELGRRLRLAADGMLSRIRWRSLEEGHAPPRTAPPFD